MKKGWKLVCLSSLVVLMILSIAGCGGKASIIGDWQSTDNQNAYIEFTQDGKLIIDTGINIVTGTYEFISENYIKVEISGLVGALLPFFGDTWRYEVAKSDLTLSAGSTTKSFKRVEK